MIVLYTDLKNWWQHEQYSTQDDTATTYQVSHETETIQHNHDLTQKMSHSKKNTKNIKS
jgi:hypothetical protein